MQTEEEVEAAEAVAEEVVVEATEVIGVVTEVEMIEVVKEEKEEVAEVVEANTARMEQQVKVVLLAMLTGVQAIIGLPLTQAVQLREALLVTSSPARHRPLLLVQATM